MRLFEKIKGRLGGLAGRLRSRLPRTRRGKILFYGAAGSSIALGVVKGVLAVSGASFIVMAMMFGGIFGVVIDIVLLVVVVTGDKRAFSPENTWAAPPTDPPPLPL